MPRTLSAQQSDMPVVVVAGGAGFLGSHLCESLLQSGVKVIALDDLATGSIRNLAEIKQHPHFEFIECNINREVPAELLNKPITHVIHAAGVETHGESQEATLAMALTGAFGTKNLLDLAVSTGAHFLLISSINVYEGLASATNLAYYYGSSPEQEAKFSQQEAKRYAEGLCELYSREYNLDVRVARLSQLYGPRMDLRSPELLARLIKSALAGEDLEVDADGSSTLLLTYVSDAVYGISRLLFAQDPSFKGSIYAFANPEKVSVISIAYTLRDFLPAGKEVKFLPGEKAAEFLQPKIAQERVKRDLDWEPTIPVTDGLKEVMASLKKLAPPLENHDIGVEHLSTVAPLPAATTTQPTLQRTAAPITEDTKEVLGLRFRGSSQTADQPDASVAAQPITVPSTAPAGKTKPKKAPRRSHKVPSWWRRLLFATIAGLVYLAVARPVIHTIAYGAVGGWEVKTAVNQAKSLHFDQAQQSFSAAERSLQAAADSTSSLGWQAAIVGQSPTLAKIHQGLVGAAETSGSLATLSQAAKPTLSELQHLAHFDLPKKDDHFGQTLLDTQKTVAQAQVQLTQAQRVLAAADSAKVAGASWQDGKEVKQSFLDGLLSQGRAGVEQLSAGLDQLQTALAILPGALGDNGPKAYLVMLQNSNELRPTGGFLGSYALIKLDKGRVVDFTIDDMYNPAGQLQSTEAAPLPLQTVFGNKTMSLVDANWSVDATVSGAEISKLYTQATGQEIDGVVFATTQTMKLVLAAVGPVKVDGYKETVTADNFTQLAQVYSDVGFTPGSTGKKDFLGQLANRLLASMQSDGAASWLPVGKAIVASLQQHEVQLWSADSATLAFLDTQKWSGRIVSTKGDYLRVVDANVGGNKANFYVERHTDYAINMDRDSSLHGVATVTWKHAGTSATWPGGDYLSYTRIYTPLGSVLNSTSGFDRDEVTTSQEGDKTVFGGFVTVSYHSQKAAEVRYSLPLSLGISDKNDTYQIQWQKQPGIENEALKVTFNTPIFMQTSDISEGGHKQADGSVVWSGKQNSDTTAKLKLLQHIGN